MGTGLAPLDYQTPGTDRPPRTRVRIEAVKGGGVRFTDPPLGGRDLRARVVGELARRAFSFAIGLLILWQMRFQPATWRVIGPCVAGLALWSAANVWRDARRRQKWPTVVEVIAGRVQVFDPAAGAMEFSVSEVRSVRAVRAKGLLGWWTRRGRVRLHARWTRLKLLPGRPY